MRATLTAGAGLLGDAADLVAVGRGAEALGEMGEGAGLGQRQGLDGVLPRAPDLVGTAALEAASRWRRVGDGSEVPAETRQLAASGSIGGRAQI